MSSVVEYSGNAQQLPATLDKAEQAIALASGPAEIKQVMAMMSAAVAFAKTYYKDQKEIIDRAKGLQARAERKLGELLQQMPKQAGARGVGKSGVPNENPTPTLSEIGIDKKTSARAQKLAALPDEVFADVESGKVSVAKAIASPTKKKPARTLEVAPAANEQMDDSDHLAEAHDTIADLAAENEALADRLAVSAMDASEEEKQHAAETIAELRHRVHTLEQENDALKVSRDTFMQKVAEMQKQVNLWKRKAEKVAA